MKLSSIILLTLSVLALASTSAVEADSNTVSCFRKETLPANDTRRLLTFTHPIADFPFCNRMLWQASSTDPLSSLVGWYVI
jgi:hypothetical protein